MTIEQLVIAVSLLALIAGVAVTAQFETGPMKELTELIRPYSAAAPDQLPTEQDEPELTFLESMGLMMVNGEQRNALVRRLQKAGRHDLSEIGKVLTKKVLFAAIGGGLALLLILSGGWLGFLLVPVFAVVGFFLPDLLLYNEALKRTEELEYGLADAIDLLAMCVESGLSFEAALSRVVEADGSVVSEELGSVLGEMRTGATLAQAFEHLASRNTQPDLLRFASAMQQVDRLGVSISKGLREQSDDLRSTRRERAREQAQKVPIKILMPVMLCFLPGIFIIILGPAIVTIVRALSGFGS